jgi:hypothetical protein
MKGFVGTEAEKRGDDAFAQQVQGARNEFWLQAKAFRQELLNQKSGRMELYWAAKRMESELAVGLTRLDIAESARRHELLLQVSKKMAELVPHSVIEKMSLAEANPGEIVLRLIDVQAENEALAKRAVELEREIQSAHNATEVTSIAFANAEAGAELSRCEVEALEDLGLDDTLPRKFSESSFGMGYFRDVLSQKRQLSSELSAMQVELSRMRGSVRQAVNVLENAPDGERGASALLRECEGIARKYFSVSRAEG